MVILIQEYRDEWRWTVMDDGLEITHGKEEDYGLAARAAGDYIRRMEDDS